MLAVPSSNTSFITAKIPPKTHGDFSLLLRQRPPDTTGLHFLSQEANNTPTWQEAVSGPDMVMGHDWSTIPELRPAAHPHISLVLRTADDLLCFETLPTTSACSGRAFPGNFVLEVPNCIAQNRRRSVRERLRKVLKHRAP